MNQAISLGDALKNEPITHVFSSDLKRVLEAAAAAAQQGRRREINGAIVLAAIVGDGKSTAAHLLRNQGLTFEEAIRALQRAGDKDDLPLFRAAPVQARAVQASAVEARLKDVLPDELTPKEALALVYELRDLLKK